MNQNTAAHIDFKDAISLLLTNQQQIHENIKFADAKALAFSAINTALLGAIFGLKSIPNGSWLCVATLICADLLTGIAFALLVIKPRGAVARGRGEGVVDANRISQYHDDEKFHEACKNIEPTELLKQTQTFIFDRAIIDREKYSWLEKSIWVSAFGWLVAIIFLAAFKVSSPESKELSSTNHPNPPVNISFTNSDLAQSEAEPFNIEQSAVHLTKMGREAHTFLIDKRNGDVWQMTCNGGNHVTFQMVHQHGQ